MASIPIIAFAAYSKTGKTTLIEQIVRRLKADSLRVAVVKHDGHSFEIDHEGKDSWRFQKAGADVTVISSKEKTAIIEQGQLSLSEVLAKVQNVDIILVEGYKNDALMQIGINRRASGKGLPHEPEHYVAIMTDEVLPTSVPLFALDDIEGITELIKASVFHEKLYLCKTNNLEVKSEDSRIMTT